MLQVHTKKILPILSVSYIALLGFLLLIVIISAQYNIPLTRFVRDPVAVLGGNPFTGILSNLGILFWCSTTAICLFTAATTGRKNTHPLNTKFLFFSGLLTLLLLLDDFFLLHETVFPDYLNIPELVVYSAYLGFVLIYILKFREFIMQTEYILLFLAFFFFGLSMLSDIFLPLSAFEHLIEDGFKMFGIITWFIFHIRTCFTQIQNLNKQQ